MFGSLESLIFISCVSRIWTFLPSQEENKCAGAEENGVSILHGNALAFVKVSPSLSGYMHPWKFQYFTAMRSHLSMNKPPSLSGYVPLKIQCTQDNIRKSAQLSVWQSHEGLSADSLSSGYADRFCWYHWADIRMRLIRTKSHWYAKGGRVGHDAIAMNLTPDCGASNHTAEVGNEH